MRNWNSKIEQLVALKAHIAELQRRSKSLEAEFKLHGVEAWEGSLHTLKVSLVDAYPVDWKALCEELKPSQYYIKKHTGHTETYRLTISVKKKEAA